MYSFRGVGIVVDMVGGEDLVGHLQLSLAEELRKKTALHSLNLFGGHASAPSLLCILGSSGCETTNSRLKSLEEGIPLDPPCPPWRVGVYQFHQLRRRIAVYRNPVIVGEFSEEYVPCFANVHRMLDETLRVHISFQNLKLCTITTYKPVIAQRLCVLLLGLPDQFGSLPLESLQFPLANRPVSDYV